MQQQRNLNRQHHQSQEINELSEQFGRVNIKHSGARLRGVCKWFNRNRGFGFITPLNGDNEAIFVHRTELQSEDIQPILLEGEDVEYSIIIDKNGRPLAAQLTFPNSQRISRAQKRREDLARFHPGASGIMTGRVKWFDDQKGYGFITCDDAKLAREHRDVWVHRDDIASRIKSVAKGERVEFFIRIVRDRYGICPKAVSVTGPHGRSVRGSKQYHDQMRTKIPPPIDIQNYNKNQNYSGVVKWFNIYKGFGYIIFNDTQDEIYVARTDVMGDQPNKSLSQGEHVEFSVDIDQHQRPKACNVTGPNGAPVQGVQQTSNSNSSNSNSNPNSNPNSPNNTNLNTNTNQQLSQQEEQQQQQQQQQQPLLSQQKPRTTGRHGHFRRGPIRHQPKYNSSSNNPPQTAPTMC